VSCFSVLALNWRRIHHFRLFDYSLSLQIRSYNFYAMICARLSISAPLAQKLITRSLSSLTRSSRTVIYFWISILALCIAPFLFNPHQFSLGDFIIDYREYLRWMSRGNSRAHANSWIGYCRLSRTKVTGFKKKKIGHPSEKLSGETPRASWRVISESVSERSTRKSEKADSHFFS
jgi:hypothetical protein